MQDIGLALITGADIPIEECQLIIHQPKLKEIALIGETSCFSAVQCLSIDKKNLIKDESLLQETSNFQIFMKAIFDERMKDKKKDVEKLFSLLFPNYKIVFLPASIIMTNQGEKAVLDDSNFQVLQDVITQIFCVKAGMGDSFNPSGKRAEEIAVKLMKARQRVAEEKGESEGSTLSTYISSIAIGQDLSINEISEYTIFQLYDTMERYQLYMAWDLDIKSRLAGGKPEDKPENWMKNIH